jgi:branched-chain amino acid aminotransferase
MSAKGTTQVRGEKIWMAGRLVAWDDATVHVLTHTLHYGLGVFEGIRCYRTADGRSAVFRLAEHVRRLLQSAHINLMTVPFSQEQIERGIVETLAANGLAEGYIRPLVFVGHGAMGLNPGDNPVRVSIAAWPWGKYLGDEGMELGIRAKISTFSRHHVNAKMTKGKTCGDYVNSILAKREALLDGYDEAILLDTTGLVSEASGENIFVVRNGEIRTPPLPTVLDGITRNAIVTLARDKGIAVHESPIARDELYIADEVFMTGTAAEVTPVRSVDDHEVGVGPVTLELQKAYLDTVRGKSDRWGHWLDRVVVEKTAPAEA